MIRLIDDKNKTIETFNLKFTKRNIDKIAYNYDAEVKKFDIDLKSAMLKDSMGRLLFLEEISKRSLKRLKEATVSRGYPDDGSGIATDDDRPPGNIVYGEKYKKIPFFNKLTNYQKIWGLDASDWKWDEFEHSMGMEDFDNYSDTLNALKKLLPDQWNNVWKRMKKVPDDLTTLRFKQAGQPHRTADDQLGDEEDNEYVEVSKDAKDSKVVESIVGKINKYIM